MYSRRAILRSKDPTDYERLRNFAYSLGSHSMYRPIIEEMLAAPGFVRKEHTMVDERAGQIFLSSVIFADKESFDAYMSNEANESLWEYLKISAEQSEVELEMYDSYI